MSIQALRVIRYVALALIGALAIGWGLVGLGVIGPKAPAPAVDALSLGAPAIAAFKLKDQNGREVSEADISGRPVAMFFGYTYCPDVCPTTLAALTSIMGKMGAEADKLSVIFVSVDPERDTVEELKRYLSSFDPRIRALTGSADEIAAIAAPLKAYSAKVPATDGAYTVDHNAGVYLIDANGKFAGTIAYGEDAAVAQEKLERLIKGAR